MIQDVTGDVDFRHLQCAELRRQLLRLRLQAISLQASLTDAPVLGSRDGCKIADAADTQKPSETVVVAMTAGMTSERQNLSDAGPICGPRPSQGWRQGGLRGGGQARSLLQDAAECIVQSLVAWCAAQHNTGFLLIPSLLAG